MPDLEITGVRAREILDSRGRPTVEADVQLRSGALGRASAPSGASTGRHEATELRDGDPARYRGRGVLAAVANVVEEIGPAIVGRRADDQETLDQILIDLDGTPNRGRLGANAMLSVSVAACRAAAIARGAPLWRHIADLSGSQPSIPLPMVNIISGGLHAGQQIDIQDVLVMPLAACSFKEALETAATIHEFVGDRVRAAGFQPLAADEGGWGPPVGTDREAIAWVADAIALDGRDTRIALDVASSRFFDARDGCYHVRSLATPLSTRGWVEILEDWVAEFPIVSLEDGLAEDDWGGWEALTTRLPGIQLVGDDLLTTNAGRLSTAVARGIANAVLVKPNQAGTLTEALRVIAAARQAGYATIVSARSGETEDPFIADLAVGSGAGQIKVGSVTRSERLSKWNQLLRIEEERGLSYVGRTSLRASGTRGETPAR